MTTYEYTNAEHTWIFSSDGRHFPACESNRDYVEFLASGATAADYVAPPAPPEPTLDDKLASIGLSLDDLKEALK